MRINRSAVDYAYANVEFSSQPPVLGSYRVHKTLLTNMKEGIIASLRNGFGFIKIEGEADLFFHANELQGVQFDELREGDKLSFEVGEGPKGKNAVKVSRV